MVRLVSLLIAGLLVACAQAAEPRLADPDAGADAAPDGCVAEPERCNDADDDCDGMVDEDFADRGLACAAGIGACAADGVWQCSADGAALACDAVPGTPATESCDGVDNDCDDLVDEAFQVGQPCDGADADVCADGVIACAGPAATMCTDGPDDAGELCDAFDNDCDGAIDEGFGLGAACDGADTDACIEGAIVCDGPAATTCSDTTTSTVEVCNGVDDDCQAGIDDPWPVGMSCAVGLGMCLRSGQLVCNGGGDGVACSASAGAPAAEVCGSGTDEDCNGSDATCPANDLATGAIDISAGGTFTVDLAAAHDDNWATLAGVDCGEQGGRDVFYQFTLPAPEVVYYDTLGANFDSVVRVFAGSCAALGAVQRCSDDACASTRSQDALALAAGTYCLVVDQYKAATTTGASTLTFRRGGRSGLRLPGTSGSVTGTTTGQANLSIAGCEANSMQPDVAYFFPTCTGTTTISASTCTGTAFDAILSLRTGAATSTDVICDDDTAGCGNGLQARISNQTVTGANLRWLIVDGYGTTGNGTYTLSYTIQ